jgi:hypothetical protein
MLVKSRVESLKIVLLRLINARMHLSEKEFSNYTYLKKGYEGEIKSDLWLEELSEDWLVIHDLLLEYNNSKFQIDTLLISHDKIYLLDVKNFEGDYYVEGDKWYRSMSKKKEVKNPVHQLERCETLLRAFLRDLGYNVPLESYLIFINPEFHLYLTSINPSLVFHSQTNRFLKKLNSRPVKLNKRHLKLAEQLVSLHKVEPPYPRLPAYQYEWLEKGILCLLCFCFFTEIQGSRLTCGHCGYTEGVESAVLRSVTELTLLFPDRKITTKIVQDWCKIIKSEKTIRRILLKNYKLNRNGRSSYYSQS